MRRLKGLGAVLADHGINSISNVLFVVLVARSLPPDEFGVFSIGYSALVLLVAITRNGITVFVSLEVAAGQQAVRTLAAKSGGLIVLGAPLASVLVLGFLALSFPVVPASAALLALMAPLIALQDLYRYTLIALGRPGTALFAGTVWTSVLLVGPLFDTSAVEIVALWGLGALISLLIAWWGTRIVPTIRGAWLALAYRRHSRLANAGTSLLSTGSITASLAAVAAIDTPETAGALAGAATLMGPVNVLVAALVNGSMAHAARLASARLVRRHFLVGGSLVSGVALVWGLALNLVPEELGFSLLGETWSGAESVLPAVAVQYMLAAASQAGVGALVALDSRRSLIISRGTTAVLRMTLSAMAAAAIATAASVAWAQVAATFVGGVVTWVLVQRSGTAKASMP